MRSLRLILLLVLILAVMNPLGAGPEPPDEYPTLTALAGSDVQQADLVDLARRFDGIDAPAPAPPSLPQVGDVVSFKAHNLSSNIYFEVDARLQLSSDYAHYWVEEGANFDIEGLATLSRVFDTRIYEPVRALWGEESNPGVDGDPRLHIVFLRGLGGGTGAYFARRNIFPAAVVPESNERELFFVNLDAYAGLTNAEAIASTLAHEFQHMIRVNMNDAPDSWLNEGFSVFTEAYLGFTGSPAWFANAFLSVPQTQLNSFGISGPRDADYGAGLLFSAYFYEQFGEDGLRKLSRAQHSGLAAAAEVLAGFGDTDLETFFGDWVAANWIQNAASGYGYSVLELTRQPALVAVTSLFPYMVERDLNQYAADYYQIEPEAGMTELNISLTIPETVPLVPAEVYSGEWVWYGNRGDLSHTLLSRTFDLSDVDSATLVYNTWYRIEADWDYVYLTASGDGGETWTLLAAPSMSASDPNAAAYGPGYTGASGRWLEEQVSLDDYAGGEVIVQFEMVTDDAINEPGLLLDDVSVPEIDYSSDFETDGGGWEAAGWVYMDNRLPQRAWVQVLQRVDGETQITRWLSKGGESTWTVPLEPDADEVVVIVAPFAPVTTVPAGYELMIDRVAGR